MTNRNTSQVLQHLRRAVLLRDGAGLTDGQLLECFLTQRDEAAFAALVRRHGPMVWGVCRRVLQNHHDAEDAFQATFFVLVRKAASIVPREMVANWLYGVAHQTALKARSVAARRKKRERQVVPMPEPAVEGPDRWHDLQPLLDQELSRLPDKYRIPIILCDLEGKTRKEAARQLGWPEGTVAGRLATARKMLANRLARRGVTLSAGALAAVLAHNAACACVPPSVVSSTIQAASLLAAGEAAASVISANAAALTEGVLKTMLLHQIKSVVAVFLVLAAVGIGVSGVLPRSRAQVPPPDSPKVSLSKQDAGNLKETVLALEKRLWEAYKAQDRDTFQSLLADDFVCVGGDGKLYTKADNLDYVAKFRVMTYSMKDVKIVLLTQTSAIVTYKIDYQVRPTNGTEIESTTRREASAWAQRRGKWWCVFVEEQLAPKKQGGLVDRVRQRRPQIIF
jgi:RNA polymerase sigma factor (sigma-70 family)